MSLSKSALAILTLLLLVISWWAPLFTITELWIFDDRVSMVRVITTLFESGNYLLLLLVATASMILPLIKALLILLQTLPATQIHFSKRVSQWITALSRWAMLDIWVVALMVVVIKLNSWADANVEWGLYLYLTVVPLLWWQSRQVDRF